MSNCKDSKKEFIYLGEGQYLEVYDKLTKESEKEDTEETINE